MSTHIVRLSKPCEEHPGGLYWSAMRDDRSGGVVTNRDDASRYGRDHAAAVLAECAEDGLAGNEPGVEDTGDDE